VFGTQELPLLCQWSLGAVRKVCVVKTSVMPTSVMPTACQENDAVAFNSDHSFVRYGEDNLKMRKPGQSRAHPGGFCVPTEERDFSQIIEGEKCRFRVFLAALPAGCVVREQIYGSSDLPVFHDTAELNDGIEELGLEYVAHMGFSPLPAQYPSDNSHTADVVMVNVPGDFSNHGVGGQINVRNVYLADRKLLVTTRAVACGEEFFNDYTLYGTVPWFEQHLEHLEMCSIRQFGVRFNKALSSGDLESGDASDSSIGDLEPC